jgi:hypothetical protein
MQKELSYLLGVFLGDGSISQKRTFELQTIDRDFAEYTQARMFVCGKNNPTLKEVGRLTSAGKIVYRASLHDAEFCRVIRRFCPDKESLPREFYSWPWTIQKELIEGLMDSEGYVSKYNEHLAGIHTVYQMSVGIGAKNGWLKELHSFLREKGWKIGEITTSILKDGNGFFKFHFNKSDFLSRDLKFNIQRKQSRLDAWRSKFLPGSTTLRGIPKSEETKKKIGDANRGKVVSDGTRLKLAQALEQRTDISRDPKTGRFVRTGNDKVCSA